MGAGTLVGSYFEDAEKLVRKLDERGSGPTLAAWFLDDDDRWRLAIAGPRFDELIAQGLRTAYAETVEALAEIETASLMGSQVHLIPTTSSLAKGIGEIASTGPHGWTQAHRTSNVIDGSFIREIIVLRSALEAA